MRIYENVTELIGKTPLLSMNRLAPGIPGRLVGKLESFNPNASIKDRIALSMIDAAVKDGSLKPGGTIVEPTSGNTGIGLASVAAVRGFHLVLTMPSSMSVERRRILSALGAELVLTPAEKGMTGAIEEATSLSVKNDWFMPQQFVNTANPEIHRRTTAMEIWNDTNGNVDVLVVGIGTGGTITGVGEVLKEKKPGIHVVAVEPDDSAVLSGGKPGPHQIQGIGAGFVPGVLNTDIYDEIIRVSNADAMQTARDIAAKEGILVGISSGAAARAALQVALRKEFEGKLVVAILPDTGERYLTTSLYAGA